MIPMQLLESKPTPFYIYQLDLLRQTLEDCQKAASAHKFHVHYALKANVNQPILNIIRDFGFGADCVSGNEVRCAYETGFAPEKIVFAGVGKTDAEIETALDLGIFCFNCESIQELEVINEIAKKKKTNASVALRINPNVNAKTHQYITTGLDENKFGINAWEFDQVIDLCKTMEYIRVLGLHFHIGSQIVDLNVFRQLCLKVNEILEFFENRNFDIQLINVGGGLGIDYEKPESNPIPDFKAFFEIFNQNLKRQSHQQIHFELGRSLVGQCGFLVTKVLYIKEGIKTNFAIVDAGMTELLRPALYQSYHKIENLSGLKRPIGQYDVVGPICESSDCFGKAATLPETYRGDLILIHSVGAYGEVMSSGYNLRSKAKDYYF